MTNIEQRFIQLLADAKVRTEEWEQFVANLKGPGLASYLARAEQMRTEKRKKEIKRKRVGTLTRNKVRTRVETLATQVGRLLRDEASLTVPEAVAELSHFLGVKQPSPKRSFEWQVNALVGEVGPAKVLHAAHRIRNDKLHFVTNSAWPLRHK